MDETGTWLQVKGNPLSNTATLSLPLTDDDRLSSEFFSLIYDLDPEAANDPYYVTSKDFVDLHARIKKRLIIGVLSWVGLVALFIAYLAVA